MSNIPIEVTRVPRYVRDDVARPLLERAMAYFDQPGVEEKYQAWLVEYKKRKAATSLATT